MSIHKLVFCAKIAVELSNHEPLQQLLGTMTQTIHGHGGHGEYKCLTFAMPPTNHGMAFKYGNLFEPHLWKMADSHVCAFTFGS